MTRACATAYFLPKNTCESEVVQDARAKMSNKQLDILDPLLDPSKAPCSSARANPNIHVEIMNYG